MKYPLMLCSLFGLGTLAAQNAAPVVSNLSATVDAGQKKVTVSYTVADAESDPIEISLAASDNNGLTYFVNVASVTGDVGYPVTPGSGKQLVWDYSGLTGLSGPYRLRVLANDRQTVSIQDMVDRVDSLRLLADMGFVEGIRHYSAGPAHLAQVKDSIFDRFQRFGLAPYRQDFQYLSYQAQNIIGKNAGLVREDSVYIVDGHFDSVANGPGADDNGSAVIGVLEAARILSQYEFKKTIRFIGFDLEELGLLGSREYVSNGIEPRERIGGTLNFEMIGYYSERVNSQQFPAGFSLLFPDAYTAVVADSFKGNFITNVANVASSALRQKFDACAAAYVPGLRVISFEAPGNSQIAPDLRRSDHAPFWDAGSKALMLTDGAEYRNRNYHTPQDVSDSLNFSFIRNVVMATVATLAELAVPVHAGSAETDVTLPNVNAASITETNPQEWMALTPNPGDETVTVRWGAGNAFTRITVTDLNGKVVYDAPVSVTGNQHVLITEAFAAGTYVVKVSGKTGHFTQKLLVSH